MEREERRKAEAGSEQKGEPHRILCGDTVVRLRFSPEGESLEKRLAHYFLGRRQSRKNAWDTDGRRG